MRRSTKLLLARNASALVVAGALVTAAVEARAADCGTLANPVYVTGTSLVKPYFARVAAKLATAAPNPVNIIYQAKSSCVAYGQLDPGSNLTGTAIYWDGTGEQSCTLPTAGTPPDIAFGDLTWRTCFNAEQPASIADAQIYVQPVGFVVPLTSSQVSITSEECNVLFKSGASAGAQIKPWDDPRFIVIRNPNSSTQWLNGLACGVAGNQFSANLVNTNAVSADVVAKVTAENTTPNAEKTIGILATDYYDGVRDKVKMLAFQSSKQCSGAYYPDSTATSFDKKNVRDGHYGTFGYTWGMAKVDANKNLTNAAASKLLAYLTKTTVVNGADPIADAARVGLVPTCAMKVRRTIDGGDLSSYDPPEPCGCYFESIVAKSTCDACPAGTCASGKTCRFGFCESR